jgi:hypothetical protein
MPTRLHHVKAAKDYFDETGKLIVAKGQMYYWWKFKNRDRQISPTKPHSDVLKKYGPTEFETNMSDYESRKDDCEYNEDERDSLVSDIEEYRDDLQSRLENIPEQLQEASVLNEYIEQLDLLVEELNDFDYD